MSCAWCALGVLAHGGGQLLDARCGALKVAGLRFGARGKIGIAGSDLASARRDGRGAGAHLVDDARKAVADAVDSTHDLTDLIAARGGQAVREITRSHTLRDVHHLGQRRAHGTAQHPVQAARQQRAERQPQQQEPVAGGHQIGVEFIHVGRAGNHELPVGVLREDGQALARGTAFRVGQRMPQRAVLARDHLAHPGLAAGVLGVEQVLAFAVLRVVDQHFALIGAGLAVDDEIATRLADAV